MTADDRALIQRLFTLATIILEDSQSAALAGQSLKRRPKEYARYADVLLTAARDLEANAQIILLVLNRKPIA